MMLCCRTCRQLIVVFHHSGWGKQAQLEVHTVSCCTLSNVVAVLQLEVRKTTENDASVLFLVESLRNDLSEDHAIVHTVPGLWVTYTGYDMASCFR